jgi:ubiquinone/menaquinone biosynthesis C-methylase UbiE
LERKRKVPNDVPLSDDTVSEWNKNAEARHMQISSKTDISYHRILIPTIMRLIGDITNKRVIDVGCGSGYLTAKLAGKSSYALGVDPSEEMIKIAEREYGNFPQVKFFNKSIEDFSKHYSDVPFDVAVSNMSLITIPNLDEALKAISSVLLTKGILAINITHPCFYNQYRKYESARTFQYHIPHAQKGSFIISNDSRGLPSSTTHFHRPLQEYFRSLRAASFTVDELVEPHPTPEVEKLYPKPWKLPHFLSLRCIKTGPVKKKRICGRHLHSVANPA